MCHALRTMDLESMFVRYGSVKSRRACVKFASMTLGFTIARFMALFWLVVPFWSAAQSDENSEVPFELGVSLANQEDGAMDLVFDLDLGRGDWVVSSHSTDSMFGRVALSFRDPEGLALVGGMEEMPPSQWEVEPFSQLDIKVLRYDTRMSQRLEVGDGRSHDIHGEVFFVLEPLCMPFETTFVLRRQHAPEASSPVWHVTHTGSRVSFPPGTPR